MIRFQDLWAQLPIPSLVIGSDNSIQEINPAGEQFLGISSKVVLGQQVWNYLRGEDLLSAGIDRARALQRPILIGEVAAHGRNTEARTCAAHVCPLNGNNQQILILLIAHETIGNSGNGLAPMLAAHSAIGMAELLAHEIKNPLTPIQLTIDRLKNKYSEIGLKGPWLQDNISKTNYGGIRGLHFQNPSILLLGAINNMNDI